MTKQLTIEMGYDVYSRPSSPAKAYSSKLSVLIDEYEKGLLRIPQFQRLDVWDKMRKVGWSRAIKARVTIPAFFKYDIEGKGIYYLADGCQRLYTTLQILQSPEEYGFVTFEEVDFHISNCDISIVEMSCKSHDQGYQHFVSLNSKGTILMPMDVHKGKLVSENALAPSNWIYGNINHWMRERMSIIVRRPNKPKSKALNAEIRSNLALLLQYLSKTDKRTFWNVASLSDSSNETPVEQLLAEFIAQMGRDEIEDQIGYFLDFISQSVQLIKAAIAKKNGKEGHAISPGLARHLLHFCVYCRNTKFPNKDKIAYVEGIINVSSTGNARLVLQDKNGVIIDSPNIQSDSLSKTGQLCEFLGINWEKKDTRKSHSALLKGMENSHFEAFSKVGNGETFPEAAPYNRMRGTNSVEDTPK